LSTNICPRPGNSRAEIKAALMELFMAVLLNSDPLSYSFCKI
jgi:hypothetical protein